MSGTLTVAIAVIGLAGLATAVFGVLMPGGRRLEVLLALVAGAGVGIAAIAIGSNFVSEAPDEFEPLFLTCTLLGALTVIIVLALLWTREKPMRARA